jgi:hypothetical protein
MKKNAIKNNHRTANDSLLIMHRQKNNKNVIKDFTFLCVKKSKNNHTVRQANKFPKLSDKALLAMAIIKEEDENNKAHK